MKMFLTRIGFGATVVITGDVTQIDLPRGQRSGLLHVIKVLESVSEISFYLFHLTRCGTPSPGRTYLGCL